MGTLTVTVRTIHAPTCYACDADAVGVADRRRDGERALVPACKRHAWRGFRLAVRRVCIYCGSAWTRRSPDVEGDCVHQRCHDDQCAA